jgi:nicotinamide phosphoribosyltransferase
MIFYKFAQNFPLKFAQKACAILVDGEWVNVYKDPITDPGKKSKRGRINLWTSGGEFETSVDRPRRWTDRGTSWTDALIEVWRDGELLVDFTFDEVRSRANGT